MTTTTHTPQDVHVDRRSLGTLIRDLRDETTILLRQEVSLAKAEMNEKVSRVSRNAVAAIVGGAIAFAGFILLLFAGGAGLAIGLEEAGVAEETAAWLGPLIVGIVVAIIGYVMFQKGLSTIRRTSMMPDKTIESMQRNKEWMKEKMR